jgi:predicted nucleic acid-binding protein
LRGKVLAKGLRARLADALIAQSCIDHRVPLVTRDDDFRHFVALGGLRLS